MIKKMSSRPSGAQRNAWRVIPLTGEMSRRRQKGCRPATDPQSEAETLFPYLGDPSTISLTRNFALQNARDDSFLKNTANPS